MWVRDVPRAQAVFRARLAPPDEPARQPPDEQQRRWFVALKALRLGHGGEQRLAEITGLSPHTIRRGRRELEAGIAGWPTDRVRMPSGGRPAREDQDPALTPALEKLLAEETAGDPMDRRPKAKRNSQRHVGKLTPAEYAARFTPRPELPVLRQEYGHTRRTAHRG